jgi:DNA-binding NarL/FixJ family response regulator
LDRPCHVALGRDRSGGRAHLAALGHLSSARSLEARGVSGREGDILRSLLGGNSNKQIARQLGIAEATVKVHLKAVMRKIDAQNRTQAAVCGLANGFGEETDIPKIAIL